jgi:hypothetical protein
MTTKDIMELAEARTTDWFLTERGTVRVNVDYFKYPVCPAAAAFETSTAAAIKTAGSLSPTKQTFENMRMMIAASDNEINSPHFDPELRLRMENNCTKQVPIDFA